MGVKPSTQRRTESSRHGVLSPGPTLGHDPQAMPDPAGALRTIPSIDRLLGDPAAAPLLAGYRRERIVEVLRSVLEAWRPRLARGERLPASGALLEEVASALAGPGPTLTRVINATGVGLHTNLGRAVLAEDAIAALTQAARGAVALEIDLASGRRGDRDALLADELRALTGAEAGLVVNNNA